MSLSQIKQWQIVCHCLRRRRCRSTPFLRCVTVVCCRNDVRISSTGRAATTYYARESQRPATRRPTATWAVICSPTVAARCSATTDGPNRPRQSTGPVQQAPTAARRSCPSQPQRAPKRAATARTVAHCALCSPNCSLHQATRRRASLCRRPAADSRPESASALTARRQAMRAKTAAASSALSPFAYVRKLQCLQSVHQRY